MNEPVGRPPLLREGLVLGVAVLVFSVVHGRVGRDLGVATAHAVQVQQLEGALHLDVELAANRWLAARPALSVAATVVYRSYYVVLLGVLAWAWLRHPEAYRRARRVLVATGLLALVVYWAFPLSPPRFSLAGVVDVVARHDLLGGSSASPAPAGPYSAMPSLHVGWSSWCAFTVWTALCRDRPVLGWAAWLFPAVMTLVVLGTGNHYVLDIAGSALVLTGGVLAGSVAGRAERPGWTDVEGRPQA